jgi:hypothetical protein
MRQHMSESYTMLEMCSAVLCRLTQALMKYPMLKPSCLYYCNRLFGAWIAVSSV